MTVRLDIRPLDEDVRRFPRESLGWFLQGEWTPNWAERFAAWDMVVELVTRISVIPLDAEDRLLHDALDSLHSLSVSGRTTLQRHGPALAQERPGELSFALIEGHLINNVLRPALSVWHPRLRDHEADSRSASAPTHASEQSWEHEDELRAVLAAVQRLLVQYALVFAAASGAREFARSLLEATPPPTPAR